MGSEEFYCSYKHKESVAILITGINPDSKLKSYSTGGNARQQLGATCQKNNMKIDTDFSV